MDHRPQKRVYPHHVTITTGSPHPPPQAGAGLPPPFLQRSAPPSRRNPQNRESHDVESILQVHPRTFPAAAGFDPRCDWDS